MENPPFRVKNAGMFDGYVSLPEGCWPFVVNQPHDNWRVLLWIEGYWERVGEMNLKLPGFNQHILLKARPTFLTQLWNSPLDFQLNPLGFVEVHMELHYLQVICKSFCVWFQNDLIPMWQFNFLEIWYLNFLQRFKSHDVFEYPLTGICLQSWRCFDFWKKSTPRHNIWCPWSNSVEVKPSKWDNSWHTLWFCSWMAVLFCFLGKELHGTDGWLMKFDKNIRNFTRMEGAFQREGGLL